MTWLKIGLLVFWLAWLSLVAIISPPRTLIEGCGVVLLSAVIMIVAYLFYSTVFRAAGRAWRGRKGSGSQD